MRHEALELVMSDRANVPGGRRRGVAAASRRKLHPEEDLMQLVGIEATILGSCRLQHIVVCQAAPPTRRHLKFLTRDRQC